MNMFNFIIIIIYFTNSHANATSVDMLPGISGESASAGDSSGLPEDGGLRVSPLMILASFVNRAMEADPGLEQQVATLPQYNHEFLQLMRLCKPPYADTIFETSHVITLLDDVVKAGNLTIAWDFDNVIGLINGATNKETFQYRDPNFPAVFSEITAGGNQQFVLTARCSQEDIAPEILRTLAQYIMDTLPAGFVPPLKEEFMEVHAIQLQWEEEDEDGCFTMTAPLYIVDSTIVFCAEKGLALKWLIKNDAFKVRPQNMAFVDDNFYNIESCKDLRSYKPRDSILPEVVTELIHYPVFELHQDDSYYAFLEKVSNLTKAIAIYVDYDFNKAQLFMTQAMVASEIMYQQTLVADQEPEELSAIVRNLEGCLEGAGDELVSLIFRTAHLRAAQDKAEEAVERGFVRETS